MVTMAAYQVIENNFKRQTLLYRTEFFAFIMNKSKNISLKHLNSLDVTVERGAFNQ